MALRAGNPGSHPRSAQLRRPASRRRPPLPRLRRVASDPPPRRAGSRRDRLPPPRPLLGPRRRLRPAAAPGDGDLLGRLYDRLLDHLLKLYFLLLGTMLVVLEVVPLPPPRGARPPPDRALRGRRFDNFSTKNTAASYVHGPSRVRVDRRPGRHGRLGRASFGAVPRVPERLRVNL